MMALVLELDLDDSVHRAGVGGERGRPVGGDADLADDNFQVLTDRLFDKLFDMDNPFLGLFDPGAGAGPDVDFKGAGIDFGEEFAPQLRADAEDDEEQQEGGAA